MRRFANSGGVDLSEEIKNLENKVEELKKKHLFKSHTLAEGSDSKASR